jgi:propanediol dehydratase small subunit
VPFREETARRSSAEYVENMADLYQRGRKRAFIVRHIHTSFKRHIARPFGINPHLDDEDFVTELARYREVDEQRLLALLKRMRRTDVSEDELLRIASERDAILQEMLSRR